MPLGRRVAVACMVPPFVVGLCVLVAICALDRLLTAIAGSWLGLFPRNARALQRRQGWCVRRLRAAGVLAPDAVVTAFAVAPFKRGEAFRSSLARVSVTTISPSDPAPHTFECLAKFAPTGGTLVARAIFILQKNHTNEIGFYRHLAAASSGVAPRVFHAAVSPLSGHFILLLERVSDIVEHSEEVGCPVASARLGLATLARFHARHWIRGGLGHPGENMERVPRKRRRFPPRIPPVSIDFACALAWGAQSKVLRRLARAAWHDGNRPQTVIHGDARVGNMLFPRGGGAILIDWQAVRWGRAAYDVAYFLLLSLDAAVREAHEAEFKRVYHAALVAEGVDDFPFAAFEEDYRTSVLLVGALLVVPLLGGEVTIDDANRARIVSGGLAWNARLQRAAASIDTAWLERRFGVDAATFRRTVAHATLHPPRLNRPARLVAEALARRERVG